MRKYIEKILNNYRSNISIKFKNTYLKQYLESLKKFNKF